MIGCHVRARRTARAPHRRPRAPEATDFDDAPRRGPDLRPIIQSGRGIGPDDSRDNQHDASGGARCQCPNDEEDSVGHRPWSSLSGVRAHLPGRGAARLRVLFRAARGRLRPRGAPQDGHSRTDRGRSAQHVALRRPPPGLGRLAGRSRGRLHAADPRRPPRRRARPRRGLGEGRHSQPDRLVQGPRRRRRAHQGPRARASRSPRAPRPATSPTRSPPTRLGPAWSRSCSCRTTSRPSSSSRRRSSAGHLVAVDGSYDDVNRLCAELASEFRVLGVRQRQRAALLLRGLEDPGLRGRRAARLAAPRPRRRPDRVGKPADQDRQGLP